MAMADLVMPRLPDAQPSWFNVPHHQAPPSTGHRRSQSYHMPQQYQQQQTQQQQQQQQAVQHFIQQQTQPQQQRVSPPFASNSSDISPLSTSNSTSPVSPKNYHGRQVRPLYMPAVLRPTEFPGQHSTKISPTGEEADDEERAVRSSGSFTSLSGILNLSRLSRRSTGDSGKVMDWNWDLSNYAQVNGEPTRRHWKADVESEVCDDPTCKKYFNYFVRRHHCRRCGNIFCDSHSPNEVPLDESANYNPRGQTARVCNHCFGEFQAWASVRGSISPATNSGSQTPQQQQHNLHHQHQNSQQFSLRGSKTMPATPMPASPGASPTTPGKSQPEVAISVPSDWNWSTF